jgi:hypothetical protein
VQLLHGGMKSPACAWYYYVCAVDCKLIASLPTYLHGRFGVFLSVFCKKLCAAVNLLYGTVLFWPTFFDILVSYICMYVCMYGGSKC